MASGTAGLANVGLCCVFSFITGLVSMCQGENERIKNLGSREQKSELRVVEEELTRVSESDLSTHCLSLY